MRNFTLAQLRTSVRQRADVENDNHLSDAEVNGYISASYAWLYDLLVNSGFPYFECSQTITTTGASQYALHAAFYRILLVRYQVDSDNWDPVVEANPHIINYVSSSGGRASWFRQVGNCVVLYPTPPSGQTYQVVYIPAAAQLTTDTQQVDGVNGWEELIIIDAAIKCLRKKRDDTADHERDRKMLVKRITDYAADRVMTSARGPVPESEMFYDSDPASWRYR